MMYKEKAKEFPSPLLVLFLITKILFKPDGLLLLVLQVFVHAFQQAQQSFVAEDHRG